MILTPIIIIFTFLYLVEGSTAPSNDSSFKEDLQDEYYTVVPCDNGNVQTSDTKDAQAVINSNKDPKVMFGIFLYREKMRRNAISRTIYSTNANYYIETANPEYAEYWFNEQWIMTKTEPHLALLYALSYDDNVSLATSLYNYFADHLQNLATVAMVLTKDMNGMITKFNQITAIQKVNFDTGIKMQKKPFMNLVRAWARNNREPLEKDEPLREDVQQSAAALKQEQDVGAGWEENRDQLELILFKKSIKFARAVILEFEKLNGGKPMEDILNDTKKLEKCLANAYSSLVRYIKDKHTYIAQILDKSSLDRDRWDVWLMCIAVIHPQEWPKIDEAFKKDHNGDSLSKFCLQGNSEDTILAEALAVAVDPTFKPTTFKEIPIDPQPPSPPAPPPANP